MKFIQTNPDTFWSYKQLLVYRLQPKRLAWAFLQILPLLTPLLLLTLRLVLSPKDDLWRTSRCWSEHQSRHTGPTGRIQQLDLGNFSPLYPANPPPARTAARVKFRWDDPVGLSILFQFGLCSLPKSGSTKLRMCFIYRDTVDGY